MKTLDEDAEALKRRSEGQGSGRKVSQGGLGAFKILNKYSNLTNKYRSTEKPAEIVPQEERGTIRTQSERNSDATIPKVVEPQESVVITPAETFHDIEVESELHSNANPNNIDNNSNDIRIASELKSENNSHQGHTHGLTNSPQDIVIIDDIELKEQVVAISTLPSQETNASEFHSDVIRMQIDNVIEKIKPNPNISRKIKTSKPQTILLNNSDLHPNDIRMQIGRVSDATRTQFGSDSDKIQMQSVVNSDAIRTQTPPHSNADSDANSNLHSNAKNISRLDKNLKDVAKDNLAFKLQSISRSEWKVLAFLHRKCSQNRSLTTTPVFRDEMLKETGAPLATIKSSIQRLTRDQIIFIDVYKTGAGGWTKYSLSETIFNTFSDILNSEQGHFSTKDQHNSDADSDADSNFSASSKLVSNINNKLTNSLGTKLEKPTWFKDLNFTAVHPIGPMQVNSSIRDLVQERLSPEIVQEFLSRFKSWLAQQSRIQNPLAMFCEKLKELAVEGDSAILACMTEEERQIELEFAQQIEKAKAEMALIVKSKEHSAKQEFESRFESWYAQTSRSEHESLQASTGLIEYGSEIYKNVLRQKFREQQEG